MSTTTSTRGLECDSANGCGTGCHTVALTAIHPPRMEKLSQARESLLATIQDRPGLVQPHLPRLRLTSRSMEQLNLMTNRLAAHHAAHHATLAALPDLTPPDPRRRVSRRTPHRRPGSPAGGTSRGGVAAHSNSHSQGEFLTPLADPDGVPGVDRRVFTARRSQSPAGGDQDRDREQERPPGRGPGCEGRLDYASTPVTLSQLHKIMTQSDRRDKSYHTTPQNGPLTDPHTDPTTDPLLNSRKNHHTNICISIKRDPDNRTPAVRLTMRVTLPNIGPEAPSTPSTTLMELKRRERLPRYVNNNNNTSPQRGHGNAFHRPPANHHHQAAAVAAAMSVTYPDDCDDVTRSRSDVAPAILRRMEELRVRPIVRTREWVEENPLGLAKLYPPQTPTPTPTPTPTTTDPGAVSGQQQQEQYPVRRIIKLKLKSKASENCSKSIDAANSRCAAGDKRTKRIRLPNPKTVSQNTPPLT